MSNLLFFSRSCAYRHAARTELQQARLLLPGSERNQMRRRARALRDLARNEAWLEGRPLRRHPRFAATAGNVERIDGARARIGTSAVVTAAAGAGVSTPRQPGRP
jgi:hypothetical protein